MKKLKCGCGNSEYSITYEESEDGIIFDIYLKCNKCGQKRKITSNWNEEYAELDIYGEEKNVYE